MKNFTSPSNDRGGYLKFLDFCTTHCMEIFAPQKAIFQQEISENCEKVLVEVVSENGNEPLIRLVRVKKLHYAFILLGKSIDQNRAFTIAYSASFEKYCDKIIIKDFIKNFFTQTFEQKLQNLLGFPSEAEGGNLIYSVDREDFGYYAPLEQKFYITNGNFYGIKKNKFRRACEKYKVEVVEF